jgi:WD40 repeat protein
LLAVLATPLAGAPAAAQEDYAPITAENASQLTQVSRKGNGAVRTLTLSPDASQLVVATTIGVWIADVDGDTSQPVLHEGQGGTSSVSFNPNGSLIAGGGNDGSIMLWDTQTGETVTRLENHLYPISTLAWSPDGKLLASGDWSGIIRVWDVATWSEYRLFPTDEKIERLIFEGDSLTALSLEMEYVWTVEDNALISQNERTSDLENNTEISVGERRVLWNSDDGSLEIWGKDEQIATLEGFYDQLGNVFFTADGRVGASALITPYLWSLDTGEIDKAPLSVISPNREIEVTFGNDGIIRLLDVATGKQIAALYGHIRKVNAVAFNPDGTLLISGSDDGTLQVWDAMVQEDSGSFMTLEGHTSGVTSVAFNQTGTLIASTGYDGTLRTWGIPS